MQKYKIARIILLFAVSVQMLSCSKTAGDDPAGMDASLALSLLTRNGNGDLALTGLGICFPVILFVSAISRWPVCLPIPKALRDKVSACLERVHGAALLDRRVGALSGGELQRVLLAMALEPLPHILILDEPLSGVDIEGAAQLMDMLDELRRRFDLSILLSTHDFDTLRTYSDQVVLLRETVLASGTAEQVLSSPVFRQVFRLNLGKGGS